MPEKNKRLQQTRLPLGTSPGAPKHGYKPFVPGPNLDLPAFIKQHATAYDPRTDRYDVKAFETDLMVHKHNKLYTLHLYWSKKDPISISEYIKHYTKDQDLVLDPFAGAGTTGCAAFLCGRPVILVDVSASAGFLASHYSQPASPSQVEEALTRLLQGNKADAIDKLFETKCDRCGGDALTEFLVWSDCYQCPACAGIVPLFDCPELPVDFPDGSRKKKRVCPLCLAASRGEAHHRFIISTRTQKFPPRPVACKYVCLSTCKPKGKIRYHNDKDPRAKIFFDNYDLPSSCRITKKDIVTWYPRRRMMDAPPEREVWGVKWRSGSANYREVAELFTIRNLQALSLLRSSLDSEETPVSPLLFFTWILHKCSHLMGYNKDGVGTS